MKKVRHIILTMMRKKTETLIRLEQLRRARTSNVFCQILCQSCTPYNLLSRFSRDYGTQYRQTGKTITYDIYSEKKCTFKGVQKFGKESLKIIGSTERALNIKKTIGENCLPLDSVKGSSLLFSSLYQHGCCF